MKEFCALRAKAYTYLMEDDIEDKKAKGTKKCVIKCEKKSLFNDKIILKPQQRFKSDYNELYTEEVNKIALSSNDDKRLQTFDKVITYRYGRVLIKL